MSIRFSVLEVRYYNAQLDKELGQYPQLNRFQAATGVPKTFLALGSGVFILLMIFFNFAGKLLSNILGWVYPAYRSFKALETPSQDDDKQWAVYGFVAVIESFTDILLYWFPFYFFLKTIFLLWLMVPPFNGAALIYVRILRPFLIQHHGRIDNTFRDVKSRVSAAASEFDTRPSAAR
ncbi:Receptor expression-enhancing protein 5 [Gamsiella multidivaricata]|nr:Receptor expression-enhancing protein 5 [Gamsiella multidivaricata]